MTKTMIDGPNTRRFMDSMVEGIPSEYHAELREEAKKTLGYQAAQLADALRMLGLEIGATLSKAYVKLGLKPPLPPNQG